MIPCRARPDLIFAPHPDERSAARRRCGLAGCPHGGGSTALGRAIRRARPPHRHGRPTCSTEPTSCRCCCLPVARRSTSRAGPAASRCGSPGSASTSSRSMSRRVAIELTRSAAAAHDLAGADRRARGRPRRRPAGGPARRGRRGLPAVPRPRSVRADRRRAPAGRRGDRERAVGRGGRRDSRASSTHRPASCSTRSPDRRSTSCTTPRRTAWRRSWWCGAR